MLVWILISATLPRAAAAGRLVNLSSRGVAGAGAETLTAGFVIRGDANKRVLIRGAGPALGAFGLGGTLAEVRLELMRGQTVLASNTRWDAGAEGAAVAQAARDTGAFAFAGGSNDAAVLVSLAPGNYTALVSPARSGAAAGVALVEVYDAEPSSTSQLVNLSTRGRAGTGDSALIAGYVVAGEGGVRVLVRGIGPALASFGVGGVLANPRLELFRGGASVAYNDDWQINAHAPLVATLARGVGAFDLAPGSADAALVAPPQEGPATAQVSSAGAGGLALVEIYDTAAVATLPPLRVFDVVGFGRVAGHGLNTITGGGLPVRDYDPVTRVGNFWRIDDAVIARAGAAFATQLQTALASDSPLVVELETMLDLARFGRPNNGATAITHPDLFAAGRTNGTVGTLSIGANKTIYSVLGLGGFRRGSLSISGKSNIMLRNLRFRELWEWDDATAGQYDRNDWDYLTVTSATSGVNVTSRAHHIWIDHCDFEKAYDGLFDFVHGADLITVSWCRIGGMTSGETARWVGRQMEYLEANRASFPYYNAQRATASAAELLARETFQKKSNLVGNATDAATQAHDVGHLNVTFHHNHYLSVDQRMPRMRFGNAHVFNLLADSSAGRGVSGLTLMGVAATSGAAVRVDNAWFTDVRQPITNVAGTEPVGFVTVLGSANFESATNLDRGFAATPAIALSAFAWNRPAAATGIANWPQSDTAIMPAGYVPAGRTLAEYLDAKDYLAAHLTEVGTLVPADINEANELRPRWWTGTAGR